MTLFSRRALLIIVLLLVQLAAYADGRKTRRASRSRRRRDDDEVSFDLMTQEGLINVAKLVLAASPILLVIGVLFCSREGKEAERIKAAKPKPSS